MRTHVIGMWLVLACLCFAPNQGQASPSIEAMLAEAESVRSADPAKFRRLLREIGEVADQATPAQKEQIEYLNAYAQAFAGKFDESIMASRRLMEATKDMDVKIRAGALMVNSYALTRQFTEGLRQLEETMELLPQAKNPDLRIHTRIAAATIYNKLGQYEIGLGYAQQLLASTLPARPACVAGYLRLESLLNLDRIPYDDAEISKVIDQCEKENEAVATSLARVVMARKWASKGQRKKAIALLQDNLSEIEGTRYPLLIGEVHSLLAQYLLEEEDVAGAKEHAQKAVALSAGITYSLPLVMAYRTLYEIEDRGGSPEAALSLFRKYAEADKAYLNDVKAREMAYQIVRQEMLQKNQQISLLDKQNQVLQLQSKLDQKSAQNTRLIVMLLVMLVASIGYWAYKIKRVQLSLKQMAETDALTGVCNRHHFTLQAERALAQCARADEEVSLIMFDLDHFKLVNDRYGHQTGDWVLKQVADACKGFCRRIDVLGRLGGEEFAILMYGCDLRGATRVAEDCRVRLAQIDTRETGHTFAVTASFGVTSSALSGYSLAKLLSHADKMLYRAKHMGRNRVCMFEGGHVPLPEVPNNVLELPHRHDERLESLRS